MERVADGKVRIEDPMGEIKQLGGENAESMRAAEPVEVKKASANERAAEMQKPAAEEAEAQKPAQKGAP